MVPIDRSKRSIVKHATGKSFNQQGRGKNGGGSKCAGFNVGPRHAPDGAYLGKVKRIKANLIANAKTKRRFFKAVNGEDKESGASMGVDAYANDAASLGKFAPEAGPSGRREGRRSRNGDDRESQDDESERIRRHRAYLPPGCDEGDDNDATAPKRSKGRSQPDGRQSKSTLTFTKVLVPEAPPPPRCKYASREEAMEARAERLEKWNRASGSAMGKKRGQPDLGARMEVLLDRIRGE